jgi:hypothetical protein
MVPIGTLRDWAGRARRESETPIPGTDAPVDDFAALDAEAEARVVRVALCELDVLERQEDGKRNATAIHNLARTLRQLRPAKHPAAPVA